jgi:hypothetical protein
MSRRANLLLVLLLAAGLFYGRFLLPGLLDRTQGSENYADEDLFGGMSSCVVADSPPPANPPPPKVKRFRMIIWGSSRREFVLENGVLVEKETPTIPIPLDWRDE